MNKLAPPPPKAEKKEAGAAKAASPKAQSHIHQARNHKPDLPTTGPMADMLKRMFGKKD